MNIEWYPGHMTDAMRNMQKNLKLIDLVIEIRDARIPDSSANPQLEQLASGKKRLIILNKEDLADPSLTEKWVHFLTDQKMTVIPADARNRRDLKLVQGAISQLVSEKRERDRKRGILAVRPVKAMVVGIPNVGKSTWINTFVGKASAKTGNKPGVTRGNQWIRLSSQVNLLDTPGVLWPKFSSQSVGRKLAVIGAVGEHAYDTSEITSHLLVFLLKYRPETLEARYGMMVENFSENPSGEKMMEQIAVSRKLFLKGQIPDVSRAGRQILEDFRSGKLGRITLDSPREEVEF